MMETDLAETEEVHQSHQNSGLLTTHVSRSIHIL